MVEEGGRLQFEWKVVGGHGGHGPRYDTKGKVRDLEHHAIDDVDCELLMLFRGKLGVRIIRRTYSIRCGASGRFSGVTALAAQNVGPRFFTRFQIGGSLMKITIRVTVQILSLSLAWNHLVIQLARPMRNMPR